jgi:aminoglycoside phosphotransferase (APT) family kinase protein
MRLVAVRRTFGSLGELDDTQLQTALDRFDLGTLVSAEPLTNGLFGKNVALHTDRGSWVLRGDPWPMVVTDQFRRERFFADAVRGACEVPVPWPVHIEPNAALFGWPYALMPKLPGRAIDTASTEDVDWDAVANALGRTATALRAVVFPSFGEWSSATDDVEPFVGSASDWLAHRSDEIITACGVYGDPLSASDVGFIRDTVSSISSDLDNDPPSPHYIHHDLKAGNVVVDDVDSRLEVTGLFDLGEGRSADPVEDLARATWDLATQVGSDCAATFLAAHGAPIPRPRLRGYIVLDLLVVWEFGSRHANRWFEESTFEAWCARLMRRVDRALSR